MTTTQQIKSHLIEVVQVEREDIQTLEQAQEYIKGRFNSEYGHNIIRKGEKAAFYDWIMGLALDTYFTHYDIQNFLVDTGTITEKNGEDYTGDFLTKLYVKLLYAATFKWGE